MMYAATVAAALLLAPQALALKAPVCGSENTACCGGKIFTNPGIAGECAPGLSCSYGLCLPTAVPEPVPCGELGEPGCTGDGVSPCSTGLEADAAGFCVEPLPEPVCGGESEACCPESKCDLHTLGCVGGICVACGDAGEPACTEAGVSPCNSGLVIDSAGVCAVPEPEPVPEPKPVPPPAPAPPKGGGEGGDEGGDEGDDEGDEGDEGMEGKGDEGVDEGDEGDEGMEGKGDEGVDEGDEGDEGMEGKGDSGDEGDEGKGSEGDEGDEGMVGEGGPGEGDDEGGEGDEGTASKKGYPY